MQRPNEALRSFHANSSCLVDYAAVKRGEPYDLPHLWQACLQIVFAIGAVYIQLISEGKREDQVYHSRAWLLSQKTSWWSLQPDLTQMQIAGARYFGPTGKTDSS